MNGIPLISALRMRSGRPLNRIFLFILFLFLFRRIPGAEERRPHNACQQHYIQLVTDWDELKVKQLNGNPKGPLRNLRVPQHVGDAIVDLLDVHSLHKAHGTVVETVGNPGPVDKLLLYVCFVCRTMAQQ